MNQDLANKIDEIAIKPGQNFISGDSTSCFATTPNSVLTTLSNTADMFATTIESSKLIDAVTENALNSLTNELMSYTANAVVKLLSIPLDAIKEKTLSYVSELTYTPNEVIEKLTKGSDVTFENSTENLEETMVNDLSNELSYKSNNMQDKVSKTLDKVNDGISLITSYISMGSKWVESNINTYTSMIAENIEGEISEIVESAEEYKNGYIDKIAMSNAQKIVKQINDKTEKTLKRSQEKIEEEKNKITNEAKTSVQTSIMSLIGLLGS